MSHTNEPRAEAAEAEVERLTRECLDREATEVDARERLRRAEERLAGVEALFAGGPDTPCRTTWPDGVECVEVPMADLRRAFGIADD